jgi:iron complex transport system substrate-binding protein
VRTLRDIPRLVRMIGEIAATPEPAQRAARALDERIDALARRAGSGPALPVFVEIWHRPLMTVNGAHLISDVLRTCGARNVFAGAPLLSFVVSREQLLEAQPQAIVANALPGEQEAAIGRWSDPLLPAVRKRQIFAMDPRLMHSQGPRLLDVAGALCADFAALEGKRR